MTAATTATFAIAAPPRDVWRPKWSLYAIEAALLGTFMISACCFVALIEHPSSPVRREIDSTLVRRAMVGAAMGLTALALIYSRPGKRSGALMNPAMTLCFLRLRRMCPRDAAGYIAGQFVGALAGVGAMAAVARMWVAHPSVRYVATAPGRTDPTGLTVAWTGEFVIAFLLVTVTMSVNKWAALARFTGCFAAALVALYITFEAPISGMSLNPARSFASAAWAHLWTGWWIYFTAPVLGMLAATELLRVLSRVPHKLCGRFSHSRHVPSIFECSCLGTEPRTSNLSPHSP
jgi:aquaporin Z